MNKSGVQMSMLFFASALTLLEGVLILDFIVTKNLGLDSVLVVVAVAITSIYALVLAVKFRRKNSPIGLYAVVCVDGIESNKDGVYFTGLNGSVISTYLVLCGSEEEAKKIATEEHKKGSARGGEMVYSITEVRADYIERAYDAL